MPAFTFSTPFLPSLCRPLKCPRPRHRIYRPANVRSCATPPLIIGLNQYSHDASCAILNARTGHLLFALSKERISRRKHDAGHVAPLVTHAIHSLATQLGVSVALVVQQVRLVVANNHHFRIASFERRLPFLASLNYVHRGALSQWNLVGKRPALLPQAEKVELSHHLAHAYSAVAAAPFDRGLVLVMDGMGDSLDDWLRAQREQDYYCELRDGVCPDDKLFRQFPHDVVDREGVSFREAESAYLFRRDGARVELTRLFKRWTAEVEPSELPNHSFEEMESVGAMYSRVSAIIFKDWNACGKVMGLAPWAIQRMKEKRKSGDRHFINGNLYDGTLSLADGKLRGLDYLDKSWSDVEESSLLQHYFEDIAFHVQADLEDVVTNFVSHLVNVTGQRNLVFAGGVALNSSLNSVLSSRPDLDNFFVPPHPGDEGIAIGCAAFGLSHLSHVARLDGDAGLGKYFVPYHGKVYRDNEFRQAIDCFSPWISYREADVSKEAAEALAQSRVVAWFQGRSEVGPRALGNRSILADPRSAEVRDFVNKVVKKRESFRPFAPSVLAENAHEWFAGCNDSASPYMSVTKRCLQAASVPAVVHVDGTSRLQTVLRYQNPRYHAMISRFRDLTGVPMVLNTSFNVAGEPIVESPSDALRTFLDADGIDYLMFPNLVIEKKAIVVSEASVCRSACSYFRSHQVQDSAGSSLSTTVSFTPLRSDDDYDSQSGSIEYSKELTDSLELEILETIHSEGDCLVSDLTAQLGIMGEEEDASNSAGGKQPDEIPTLADVIARLENLVRNRLVFCE